MTNNYDDLNEAETRAELIDPMLRASGWEQVEGSRVRREMIITQGALQGGGRRGKQDIADYVLVYKNQKLAVIEAKRAKLRVTEGLGQAKEYATKLQTRFAYSTNGRGLYRVDMNTGSEGDVEHRYPTPDELWEMVYDQAKTQERVWRNRFSTIPFEDKGGQWQPRYYQHNAITKTLEALASGQDRILLTLATGTGKTAIAFQIAWKLFHARWNLTDWRAGIDELKRPSRQPRILFLADRNILADQAFNDFSAFPEDALVRIAPDVIRKRGRVPKNGSIFFTIFQTFMTKAKEENSDEDDTAPSELPEVDEDVRFNFGDYPPDFFDIIMIDECHRGGANDESSWRGILEYFAPAVQLGLTATPKRTTNADTYDYFGKPIYTYSLKEGINDGFLTPFRVKQIQTTLDDYLYTPDDEVLEGEIDAQRRYKEGDFNRVIEIAPRERKRVEIFMDAIDQREKTLVFCATQDHALIVRDLINQLKESRDPNYCVRVTADDGARGEQHLRTFRDNEKTIPTIITTSRKLSTGVDARNVRNIVLMRPVNSMIEFKQIIGRGTRLFDGKEYFTIYDFVKAYEHFSDEEWDGPPRNLGGVRYEIDNEGSARFGEPPATYETETDDSTRPQRIKIRLADGKERTIQHMTQTSFWSAEGKPMSATEFIEQLFGDLPDLFRNEAELRELWSRPDTRRKLLDGLAERGYGEETLMELGRVIDAEKSDLYDVLAYIAYSHTPLSRTQRADNSRNPIFTQYGDEKQREFLQFVLDHYIEQGVGELDEDKLPTLLELKYGAAADAIAVFGTPAEIRNMFIGFQKHLYGQRKEAA